MMIKSIRNIIKKIPYIKKIRAEGHNPGTKKGSANIINSKLPSYPPFDFNFYLKVDISFKQKFERSEELLNLNAKRNLPLFNFTPYVLGKCNICGEQTAFFCKNLIFPRDFLLCMHCGSTSRYRSIARGILAAIEKLIRVKADSIADLSKISCKRKIRIYDTQPPFSLGIVTYPIPLFLSRCDYIDLYLSDYKKDVGKGEALGPLTTNQDLQSLTYEDDLFDVVITSDIMEHVRLENQAHNEIKRVMKKGGFYIFTVPHSRQNIKTEYYVQIVDPFDISRDINIGNPVYHGDPNSDGSGVLVYQYFGTDLDDKLKSLGFEVDYSKDDFLDLGILDTELFYCQLKNKKKIN